MVSTAVGIVGGSIRKKTIGLSLSIILRFIPIIGFSLFPDYPNAFGYIVWRWYEYTWFSFADGGSTAIMRSGIILHGSFSGVDTSILLAFWSAIIMYLAYLLFAFLVSHVLLHHQGFLSATSK